MARQPQTRSDRLKEFFSSGLFSIVLGTLFLIASYLQHLADKAISAFVILFGLMGVVLFIYGILIQTAGAGGFYDEIKKFSTSGFFYIALGGVFLWLSHLQIGTHSSHPTFMFLLAILGVAIVLYGTGTQAAGEGKTGKINVAIAGGAGVLALVLGYGVVEYNPKIQQVFSSSKYYVVVKLVPDKTDAKLKDYIVRARRPDGEPLHLWKRDHQVQILVPVSNTDQKTELAVLAYKRKPDGTSALEFSQDYQITWETERFVSNLQPGNSKRKEGEIESASQHGPNVRFQINDVLFVTPAFENVTPIDDGASTVPVPDSPPIEIQAR